MEIASLPKLFRKFNDTCVLVIGDLMIDEYIWGRIERISPEAPVPVVEVEKSSCLLGGAGNVLNNLIGLGGHVLISSVIGLGSDGDYMKGLLNDIDIDLSGVFSEMGRTTIKKTRVMGAMHQQVIRIDRETKRQIGVAMEDKVYSYVKNSISKINGIILSDYDKGVLTENLIARVIHLARKNNIPVIVDPKRKTAEVYRGATMMTPNLKEASWLAGTILDTKEKVVAAGKELMSRMELDAILITRSGEGMTLLEKASDPINIPTHAREVYDVSGAGDTVTAGVSLGIASGASFEESARLANVAAGIAVGKVGTATVTQKEILEYLGEKHAFSDHKIVDRKNLKNIINSLRIRGVSIAFTFGVFDPFNLKFIKQLQNARRFGNSLIVGIVDDATYKKNNQGLRPSLSGEERLHLISSLDCVSYVLQYAEGELPRLLHLIGPDNVVIDKENRSQDLSFYQGSIQIVDTTPN